jgi:hypothetical protein
VACVEPIIPLDDAGDIVFDIEWDKLKVNVRWVENGKWSACIGIAVAFDDEFMRKHGDSDAFALDDVCAFLDGSFKRWSMITRVLQELP